jgi:hypothetical protein
MKNRKIKKYFMGMYVVKKYIRLTIHKLILYFLGLLKKYKKRGQVSLWLCRVTRISSWLGRLSKFDQVNCKHEFWPFEI